MKARLVADGREDQMSALGMAEESRDKPHLEDGIEGARCCSECFQVAFRSSLCWGGQMGLEGLGALPFWGYLVLGKNHSS